ncbi:MAG: PASTA domain-containing protein [Ignavibacteriales bacterium]|nr:PASTA domain-containing protein [Ignavibacteriales bacterium]
MMFARTEKFQPDEKKILREFRTRFLLLKTFFALFFAAVAVRLLNIQVLEAPKYQALARKQYEQRFILPATRGNVYDRNGNVLISNTIFVSFAADPKFVKGHAGEIATRFAQVFGKPRSQYLEKLTAENKRFAWLERRVKPETAKLIRQDKLEGVVVINEPKRIYHYDDLAGPLFGFTDIDNKGISGLELELDEEVRGTNGSIVMQRDGLGRSRPSADYPRVEPVNGRDVTLTLDLTYQAILEEELKRGIKANGADGGLAVMMNPATGEILAVSIFPSLNPNDAYRHNPGEVRNRLVTDLFEPGSVFKIVTAAAAYEYRLTSPETRYNAEGGTWKINLGGKTFRLIKDTHEHDIITFQEAVEVSSNIVMAKVVKSIGPERFYRQARDFGFGIPTGVELPGELRGRLKKPNEWSGTTLQTMSYGYEVAVTPLQIVQAYAAVANKGILMKPYIVSQIRSSDGTVTSEQRPQKIRSVISEETCALLSHAFEGTVERGTAKDVRLQNVRIAGKTGTSRKYVDGKYSTKSYTASFVGYFPVEDPQIVCLVMMDNPRNRGYYGGSTSGPVFRAVAERILNTSSRFSRPTIAQTGKLEEQPEEISVPDVRTLRRNLAKKILETRGLKSQFFGKGDVVVRQSPEPGRKIEQGEIVTLALKNDFTPAAGSSTVIPDVRGMSVRRAMNQLMLDDFDVRVEGSGVVVQQSPAPGQRVKAGATVVLECSPKTVNSASLY